MREKTVRPEEDASSLKARWRRVATSAIEEVVWRKAQQSALRRMRRAEPVAVRQALEEGRSILVITADGLPGLLAALPAVRALRRIHRETRLDLLSTPLAEPLLARDALVDHILGNYPLPPLWRWRAFGRVAADVASRTYGLVFSFDPHGERRTALLAGATEARLRVSFGGEERYPFFNVRVVPEDPERYLPDLNLVLLKTLGVDVEGISGAWQLPAREREVAERLLEVKQLKGRQPLVAFDPGPGEEQGSPESLPLDWLAEAVMRKTGARGILLSESVQRMLAPGGMPHRETRDLGLSGLREAVGVLSCCDAFVGRNTGFFHLAVALGVPSVGLFSPETPSWWRPSERRGVFLLDAAATAEEIAGRTVQHLSSVWAAPLTGGER